LNNSIQSLGILWLIAQFIAGVVITLTTYNDLEETYNGSETLRALPYFSFVIQGVITALLIYPHVGLIMEIKKGIITPDTYHREEFSCCCA
jgi:fructose-specific phosphotransferase system IIC component